MFADARCDAFTPERSPDHPRFDRAKSAAELHAVVHIILFRCQRVAAQILRHEREDAAQPLDVAHIQHAEIERDEQHFVRINDK